MTTVQAMKQQGMPARGLRPASELGAERSHGIRLRYMAGCRCLKCRMANSNYEAMRARARKAGDWNGLVDAAPARRHILELGKRGVGYKAAARAAGVARTVVAEIRSGRRTQIRARTSKRILAVTRDMRASKSFVSAKRLWSRIDRLLQEGFTKAQLARRLGRKSHALQFRRDQVTVKSDREVGLLYRRLMA